MPNTEQQLVFSFNKHFEESQIKAVAYRLKQSKFTGQFCDVLVDSKHSHLYLGIECKSINLNSSNKLYFSQHFHSNERDQIEKITQFLKNSGRIGYLALELRKGVGHKNELFLIPWEEVLEKFKAQKSIDFNEIKEKYNPIVKRSGKYEIERIFAE